MSRGPCRRPGLLSTVWAAATLAAAAACARPPAPDAAATGTPAAPPATAQTSPQGPVQPQVQTPGSIPGADSVAEATCATAPLRARVVSVRQETPDTIRVEIALANVASPQDAPPGSAAARSVEAAVKALDGASVVGADGHRRMFPLRGPDGARVGPPADPPPPGGERTFWALFSGRAGPISVVLPGFSPLTGLAVAPPAASARGASPSPAGTRAAEP